MRYESIRRIVAFGVFLTALLTYWLTVEPTASYWDCTEYILNAYGMEPGHPPGNPTWMLASHLVSLLAPAPEYIALAINLTSGLYTALASLLLYLSSCILLKRILMSKEKEMRTGKAMTIIASAVGALIFTWCDTAWFSAVEAEIYAMSIFMTALVIWLMLLWSEKNYVDPHADRYLMLVAYLTGLSIGVHQLNLLCLPACALIYLFHRKDNTSKWRITSYLIFSFILIAMLLFGMMPGTTEWAGTFELLFVNTLHLPMVWGETTYLAITMAVGIAACAVSVRHGDSFTAKLLFCLLAMLSGIFAFGGHIWIGAALSAGLFLIMIPRVIGYRKMVVATWSLLLVLVGYSTYTAIVIRAYANPPINTGMAFDPFSFSSYLGRDQYGSSPLFYGRTPHSQNLRKEVITGNPEDGTLHADYSRYYKTVKKLQYGPSADGTRYQVTDTIWEYKKTPELDMFFPRIWSNDPLHVQGYSDWVGANDSTMTEVEISEAVDSTGAAVAKLDVESGERNPGKSYRPTYLQHLSFFGGYQLGYMYLRYLMWNFSGRQNDVYSQGQADAGNFITGFPIIDNAMLGTDLDNLPEANWKDNRGRNVYYMIPLILGILGIIWLTRRQRPGRRAFAIFFTIFIMTGLAIVVYLNQTPSEPRERDYSFVGSIYAYTFFIGCGVAALAQWIGKKRGIIIASIIGFGSAGWMLYQNLDDHDRSGRYVARDLAGNLLESLEPNAILIVDGDNYTFPVWYAQEVEGVRKDVRIVNLAYSTVGWYVDQLATPTDGADGVPMARNGKGYIYNRYRSVPLRRDVRTPMDAVEALRMMYDMERPEMPTMVLLLAPPPGQQDSLIVDLAVRLPRGRRDIRQTELLVLDMMATSAAQGWKRPIYWQESVARRPEVKMYEYKRGIAGVRKFTADSLASRHPDLDAGYDLYMNKFRYGGFADGDVYADAVTRDMVAGERKMMGILGKMLFERGDTTKAVALFQKMEREWPASAVPYRITKIPHSYFNEGIEAGRVYALVGGARGDTAMRNHGLRMIEKEMRKCRRQVNYRASIPQRMWHALTFPTEMGVAGWFYPIDAYLSVGGSPDHPEVKLLLGDRSLAECQKNWNRDASLKRLITNVRDYVAGLLSPEETEAFFEDLRTYYANGGTDIELELYREFDDFDRAAATAFRF